MVFRNQFSLTNLLKISGIIHYFRDVNPGIAIVAIGYNRPAALERLLQSIARARFPESVKLYISLDGGGGEPVARVAREFHWEHGEKQLILHGKNLGLREHVLRCGDLSQQHDALIALEDDLVVSPGFYDYALQSFSFYKDDPQIGGISLYHHAYNETAQFPFIPISDGSDVYFLQYASSWGQMWTKEQWRNFRSWYDKSGRTDNSIAAALPPNIRLWPENSWKKYFIAYLNKNDLFFVFPRVSLITLFGDEGTNLRIRETFLQVPLWYGERLFVFTKLELSSAVYDTWCEILPDRLKKLWKGMEGRDFGVDLYGMKSKDDVSAAYIISGRRCKSPERSFGREMRPQEENLAREIPGNYFHLGKKEDFEEPPYLARLLKCHEKKELSYWYPVREYHFSGDRILATEKKAGSLKDPAFLYRKFTTSVKYAWRYFTGRK
jgi:hypothetical protein